MAFSFKLRRGTSVEWAAKDPVLEAGEPGIETDTHRLKVGDGLTRWVALPYYGSSEGDAQPLLDEHINSETPHPVYDEGVSLLLIYQNAKV